MHLRSEMEINKQLKDQGANNIYLMIAYLIKKTEREAFRSIVNREKEHRLTKMLIIGLSRTRHGALFEAFRRWKQLTSMQARDQTSGSSRLAQLVRDLYIKALKAGWAPLKEIQEEALLLKQEAVSRLFMASESRLKDYLRRWAAVIKQERHLEQMKSLISLFDKLNGKLSSDFLEILQHQDAAERKRQAIRIIYCATQSKLSNALEIWKGICQQNTVNEKINEADKIEQIKKTLIRLFDNQTNNMREAFEKWRQYQLTKTAKERVLLALAQTTSSKLAQAFLLWKLHPKLSERQRPLHSVHFLYCLQKLYTKQLKSGFSALTEEEKRYGSSKQNVALLLIGEQRAALRQAFNKWTSIIELERETQKVDQTARFIATLVSFHRSNALHVLEQRQDSDIRKLALTRIISNSQQLLQEAFLTWQSYAITNILDNQYRQSKHENAADKFAELASKMLDNSLRDAFAALKANMKEQSMKKRFFIALLKTQYGQLHYAFQRWKNLPSKRVLERQTNLLQYIDVINMLLIRRMNHAFSQIKEEWVAANDIKINCLKKLLLHAQRKEKLAWDRWADVCRSEKRIATFKTTKRFFEILSASMKDNLAEILPDPKVLRARDEKMKLFVANLNNKMAQAFIIWKNVLYQERLKEELAAIDAVEKVKKLTNPLLSAERRLKQEILAEFKQIMVTQQRKQQVISRIFSNYYHKLHTAFEILRSTHSPATFEKQNAANSVERTLRGLLLNRLREAFDTIRFVLRTKKDVGQMIGMRIIMQTEGKLRDTLQTWQAHTSQQRELEKIATVQNFFLAVGLTLQKNAIPVLAPKTVTKTEYSALILVDLLNKLKQRKEKEGLNALNELTERSEIVMKDTLLNIPQITMTKLKMAFLNWKNQAALQKEKDLTGATRSIIKILHSTYKKSAEPIFTEDQSEYGRKMVLKRLFVNWSTRQSVLFERWKEYVRKQRLLEKALNFAKIIIACANNKQRLLRQALTRWKDKSNLLHFIETHEIATRESHISKAIDNFSAILYHQYQRSLFYGLNRIAANGSSHTLWMLTLSRLRSMLNQRLADGFDRIAAAAKRNGRIERLNNAQALGTVLQSIRKSKLYSAFSSINAIGERRATVRLALARFDNRLYDIFHRWRATVADLKHQEQMRQIEEKQRGYSGREKAYVIVHLLRRLFTERLMEGFQGIETRAHKLKLLNFCFSRMSESAKTRERHAFEIWHNQTNQKIIKQFYDLIVLEKALNSYSNALRIAAFNAIKTTASVNSEKMVIAALWKWKIFNTEVTYYNMHKIFEKKTRGLLRLFSIIEGIYEGPTRWSFNKLYKYRLRQADLKSQLNYLALVMKQQLARHFWQLKAHGQDQRLDNEFNAQRKTVLAAKLGRIAILIENRALAKAFNTWYDEVKQDKHLEEKSRLVKRYYAQRQKSRTLSDWKSFMIEYEKDSTRRTKALTLTKLLVFYQINLCKSAFESIRDHHMKTTRQQHALEILQWHLMGLSVRESFRRWAVYAKYGVQWDKTKIAKMVKILNKQAKIILNGAFSRWRGDEAKLKLFKMVQIVDRYLQRDKQYGFEVIAHQQALARQKDRIRAVNRLIRINSLCEQLQKYYAFKSWRDKDTNPWRIESMKRIAKNSRINLQIAFWRLRDSVPGDGTFISHAKAAKIKKIYHYVNKHYLLALGKAFWMIERFGRNESFSRSMISEDLRKSHSLILSPSMLNQSVSMAQNSMISFTKPTAQNALIEKGRRLALRMILNKYDVNKIDRREKLTEAFKIWRLRTSVGINALVRNLNKAIKPVDVGLIAKHGALELMVERIENAYERQAKMAFNFLKAQLGMVRILIFFCCLAYILLVYRMSNWPMEIQSWTCYTTGIKSCMKRISKRRKTLTRFMRIFRKSIIGLP